MAYYDTLEKADVAKKNRAVQAQYQLQCQVEGIRTKPLEQWSGKDYKTMNKYKKKPVGKDSPLRTKKDEAAAQWQRRKDCRSPQKVSAPTMAVEEAAIGQDSGEASEALILGVVREVFV